MYIVICKDREVFSTNFYTPENHWSDQIFCVIDKIRDEVTFDGKTWKEIEYDHL
jgi:hypothetical protein